MSLAREVTDATFEADVLERSKEVPVVVDLWAPWCGPCRQLGPILDRVAEDRAGEFELVKINIDDNPQVANALGARSIPLVIAFKDGQPVNQFLGVQPQGAVDEFVAGLSPSEAELLLIQAAGAAPDAARGLIERARELEPQSEAPLLALARLEMAAEDWDAAIAVLDGAATLGGSEEVRALLAECRLRAGGADDPAQLAAELESSPDDLDLRIRYGRALAASGDTASALDVLLEAVRRDAKHDEGAARRLMVDLFETLGAGHELTKTYRSQLSRVLF